MYKKVRYDIKKDITDALAMMTIMGFMALALVSVDEMRHENASRVEDSTVIAIQRLDEQMVTFETSDGNLWDYSFNLEKPIDIGDKAMLTFKGDEIVKVEMEEE